MLLVIVGKNNARIVCSLIWTKIYRYIHLYNFRYYYFLEGGGAECGVICQFPRFKLLFCTLCYMSDACVILPFLMCIGQASTQCFRFIKGIKQHYVSGNNVALSHFLKLLLEKKKIRRKIREGYIFEYLHFIQRSNKNFPD